MTEKHGKRIAVINNEFGDTAGMEDAIVRSILGLHQFSSHGQGPFVRLAGARGCRRYSIRGMLPIKQRLHLLLDQARYRSVCEHATASTHDADRCVCVCVWVWVCADLVNTLETIMKARDKFDYVLVRSFTCLRPRCCEPRHGVARSTIIGGDHWACGSWTRSEHLLAR